MTATWSRLIVFGWALLHSAPATYAQSPMVTIAPPNDTVSATISLPPKPKPKPRPSRTLTIINGTDAALAGLSVSADGLVADLPKRLDAGQTFRLPLPGFRSCTVAISARFEDLDQAEIHRQNICSVRTVRLSDERSPRAPLRGGGEPRDSEPPPAPDEVVSMDPIPPGG